MPIKYQSDKGEMSPIQTAEHKFPIYFCEVCGFQGAAFLRKQGERTLSYCAYDGRPVCVGRGNSAEIK